MNETERILTQDMLAEKIMDVQAALNNATMALTEADESDMDDDVFEMLCDAEDALEGATAVLSGACG